MFHQVHIHHTILGRPRHRWEDIIKTEGFDCIKLAQERDTYLRFWEDCKRTFRFRNMREVRKTKQTLLQNSWSLG